MSEQGEMIVLADGKYTVILEQDPYKFYALRYNHPWSRYGLDNLHLAMFQRIRDLEDKQK